jgi:hypothetical protein
MQRLKWLFGLIVPVLMLQGDTLFLRDGRTITGRFLSGDARQIRFLSEGGATQAHPLSEVDRIAFGGEIATQPAARNETRTGTGTRSRSSDSVVPAGTVITVRTIDPINSDESTPGQTYRASIDEAVVVDGQTIVPKGADATVQVVRVDQSGTLSGREEIALVLSEINANGRRMTPETQHAEVAAKSRKDESVKVIGGTAVVGAIIGAIAGGGRGAAIGAASGAGAGAAVQAIRGQKIEVPSETALDFTLAQPLRY